MTKKMILLITIMLGFLNITHAQNPREIAQKANNAIDIDALEMAATLQIYDHRGNVRERQIAVATKKFGDVYKTIIRFLAPADVRGTGMLIHDYDDKGDDMWVYMPSLRRTRRIVSSEKGRSFMGSEFTNADMSTPSIDDFDYKLLGEQTVNGISCWLVESNPKTPEIAEENGFSKQVAYIAKDNFLTHKVEYYNHYDELEKIMTISDYRKQSNGSYFAFKREMANVQNGRKSEYSIDQFQIGSNLQESDFTVSSLEQF